VPDEPADFADLAQWEASRTSREKAATANVERAAPSKQKRLSYIEQRELDAMEHKVEETEERLETARQGVADPAIATNARALQERYAALDAAQEAVDRLYARWAEAKR